MKLTDIEVRVLEILCRSIGVRTSEVGDLLWGRSTAKPQRWCRPAGRVLWRMHKRGLVYQESGGAFFGWHATEEGGRALMEHVRKLEGGE